MNYYLYSSFIGDLYIAANDDAITYVGFGNISKKDAQWIRKETPVIASAYAQLQEYFYGKRQVFDLPLEPSGTLFYQKVWKALQNIPYGETRSYKEIAIAVGCPKGFRAVGMANHNNPIAIVIPCHRVVAANGTLGGYAGGIEIKRRLLELEGASIISSSGQ